MTSSMQHLPGTAKGFILDELRGYGVEHERRSLEIRVGDSPFKASSRNIKRMAGLIYSHKPTDFLSELCKV